MNTANYTTTILTPDEGKFLTQVQDVDIEQRIVADRIALGTNDSPENWREITKAEADEYHAAIKAAQEARMKADKPQ